MSNNKRKIILNVVEEKDVTDWTIEKLTLEKPPNNWDNVFELAKNELKDISDVLENDKKINGPRYPFNKSLFRAFELTPLSRVKVVIMGQDPYHGDNNGDPQATGMAFSVKKGIKISPSLQNIYKEIKNTIPEFKTPTHGDLTFWAVQGVLLLNSCLTVRPHSPGSHKEVWFGFIKKVLNAIIEKNPNCIFVLWGKKSQKIKKMIGQRVTILEASHPSPFACHRGFFGCDHFNQINTHLISHNQTPIDWNVY